MTTLIHPSLCQTTDIQAISCTLREDAFFYNLCQEKGYFESYKVVFESKNSLSIHKLNQKGLELSYQTQNSLLLAQIC